MATGMIAPCEEASLPADGAVLARAEIRHLFVSPGHIYFGHHGKPPGDQPMIEVPEIQCVAGRGIAGDRFLDYKPDYKGQITFFAFEVYERLCRQLKVWNKPSSVFRRNVLTHGIDLNALIGAEFEIQGVRFLGTLECTPCYWMNTAFHLDAERLLNGNGGLRAKILSDGMLRSSSSRPSESP